MFGERESRLFKLSEPTCPALCCRGAGCYSNVGTYLPGTVLQGCGCISGVGTYLPGTVLHAVMQAV